jgi:hypothetical protein
LGIGREPNLKIGPRLPTIRTAPDRRSGRISLLLVGSVFGGKVTGRGGDATDGAAAP